MNLILKMQLFTDNLPDCDLLNFSPGLKPFTSHQLLLSYNLELPIDLPPTPEVSVLRVLKKQTWSSSIQTYLKAQNSVWEAERVLCFRDQVFPLLFPIHTSKPASARMKPRLLLGRFVIQLLESARRPCCRNTTGLRPGKQPCLQHLTVSEILLSR